MISTTTETLETPLLVASTSTKLKAMLQLLKVRLTLLVVFSGVIGYLMAADSLSWGRLMALIAGSFLITGSANTINQILEKDLDKLMKRTEGRPLPQGVLSITEAMGFAVICGGLGFMILIAGTNPFAALLSLVSLLLYAFFYTPMKQVSPISVFIGAFPGALPPLIGWVAESQELTAGAWVLFIIQFIWQFPHFWAIAWVGHDDYEKAGFKMLPTGKKDLTSALQIPIYTLLILPAGLLPLYLGISGVISAAIVTVCGVYFLYRSVNFLKHQGRNTALRVMFASFIYLPVVQIALLVDKL